MDARLLIFKVIQLGDNVVFLPVVQHLARSGFFSSIHLWTTPLARPLYAPTLPGMAYTTVTRSDFNSAWKHPFSLFPFLRKARQFRPSHCILPEDQGNTAHLLALASRAPTRVGIRAPFLKVPGSINVPVGFRTDIPIPERAWSLAVRLSACIGIQCPPTPPPPDLSHLVTEKTPGFDFLIHPGASLEYKRWLPDRFASLARQLSRVARVGWIDGEIPLPDFPDRSVEIIRTPDLASLVSQMAASRVFIGNNSGPMNLASALGLPSLIFCGPSNAIWDPYWHADRFLLLRADSLPCIACDPPLGPLNHCTNRSDHLACMKHWTVDSVVPLALDWLGRNWPARPLSSR